MGVAPFVGTAARVALTFTSVFVSPNRLLSLPSMEEITVKASEMSPSME